jgi:hypothetical protein
LNFSELLHCDGRQPQVACSGYCVSCDRAKFLDEEDVHLHQMSHGADTSDFEDFYGREISGPYIHQWVVFIFESPGGQYQNGVDVPYQGFSKRPPNKTRYWLPDDETVWPATLDDVLSAGNPYGPYLAYLMKQFALKNAYFTNAIKCGLTVNGSAPPKFQPYSKVSAPYRKIGDNCFSLFLREELRLLDPAVVFAVGDNAHRLLLRANPAFRSVCLYHPVPRGNRRRALEDNDRTIRAALAAASLTPVAGPPEV